LRLLRQAGVVLEEDPEVTAELYLYRYVMPPRTLLRHVRQMVVGQTIRLEGNERFKETVTDWYRPPTTTQNRPLDAMVDDVQACLSQTVASLKDASNATAVLLSGGLDSSILFRLAQDNLGVRESYSTYYPFAQPGAEIESPYATSAAKAFGSDHHIYHATTHDYLNGFIEAVAAAEEPLIHLQSVLFSLLFRHGLPKSANVVVSGQGADGVFGLKIQMMSQSLARKPIARALLGRWPALAAIRMVSRKTNRFGLAAEILDKKLARECGLADTRNVLWSLGIFGKEGWIRHRFGVGKEEIIHNRCLAMKPYDAYSLEDQFSVLDFLGDVSVTQSIWSKLAEDGGKSVVYPFNHPQLLDCALNVPWEAKFASPKHLLRCVARKLSVPEFIITRPKSGFGAPVEAFGPRGTLFEPLLAVAGKAIDIGELRQLQSGEVFKAIQLFTMLNHALWRRLVVGGETVQTLQSELEEELRRQGR
jgi:asparagine synthetase B (glutamine-hydrolysing)